MTPYIYKYAPRHIPFMREQVWESRDDTGVYSDLSLLEFRQFENFIGDPRVVLEVGCGLGRGSIFLNHLLRNDLALYILADRTGYTENTGAFSPGRDEFYNDLVLTEDFCRLNGVRNLITFDTEAGDLSRLPRADLILSLCSFGMHVSIERYIDRLSAALASGGTMIFGTRHESYGPDSFADLFAEVVYLPSDMTDAERERYPVENWLILRGKREFSE
jgi:SAM-dependent methyltransferase